MNERVAVRGALAPPSSRLADLYFRVRHLWLAKMMSTTLGIGGFFVAYFWVMNHPLGEVTVMPLTALDHAIAFRPEALPIYLSLWLYVALGPALLLKSRDLVSYSLATTLLSATGLLIFLFWPTAVPAADIDWSLYPSMAFLKDVDMALNACPSMHVAFAVFTVIWLERLLREMRVDLPLRLGNAVWCLAILYSTIATRQHVVFDVVAGAFLGAAVGALNMWLAGPMKRPGRDGN